eukprot:TRINITY_DN33608_c0_g1_i1.p1 TRINITY_DN33608_c0_g1~~TRINITY_DN33608_c0_g1_i1.p1  ORF type:complete len:171 (+),score=34.40 TRINITY_DN33608_c0_g1_i1:40-552(+)
MSRFVQTGQDWKEVTLSRPPPSAGGGPGRVARLAPGDSKFTTRAGPHQSAGGKTVNQQHKTGGLNHKKLDDDTETLKHKTVSHSFCITLQQSRTKKGWNQKELANACQERETTIKEYENGKAIPNNQVISKMERALGLHLRGKEAGQPIVKPVSKKAKAAAKPAAKKSKA